MPFLGQAPNGEWQLAFPDNPPADAEASYRFANESIQNILLVISVSGSDAGIPLLRNRVDKASAERCLFEDDFFRCRRAVPPENNPDRVRQCTMKKLMGKFAERFYPADPIGYAYGIRHDTDNLHVQGDPNPEGLALSRLARR